MSGCCQAVGGQPVPRINVNEKSKRHSNSLPLWLRGGDLERAKGIEPSYAAWEAAVLPLNYARSCLSDYTITRPDPARKSSYQTMKLRTTGGGGRNTGQVAPDSASTRPFGRGVMPGRGHHAEKRCRRVEAANAPGALRTGDPAASDSAITTIIRAIRALGTVDPPSRNLGRLRLDRKKEYSLKATPARITRGNAWITSGFAPDSSSRCSGRRARRAAPACVRRQGGRRSGRAQ